EPGFSFRNGGKTDGHREHAFVEKLARKFKGLAGVAHEYRCDRDLACARLETEFFQLPFGELRVGPQFLDELFTRIGIEQVKRRSACGRHGRRVRSGEKEWPGAMVQKVDQIFRTAHIAANRSDGFAESAHLDIHSPVNAAMVNRSTPAIAEDPGG